MSATGDETAGSAARTLSPTRSFTSWGTVELTVFPA
jgi:hypothetical protein